ncbi:chromosome transmission fidelity protein [Achlya hypogyna]|uniref:Chromosome transmission fidelity protein n=1 Tax=Achlya hypogyna TaxID=1202772 RepID=A0A1V9ZJJ1_ACHHY|nr:chromosome transmission fidelity protein [Achlya hypogyna]
MEYEEYDEADEWEMMYGADMEAANELAAMEAEPSRPLAAAPVAVRATAQPVVAKASDDMETTEAASATIPRSNRVEKIHASQGAFDETYVLKRPALDVRSVPCVLASGERVFLKAKQPDTASIEEKEKEAKRQWKLGVPIKEMFASIEKRKVQAVVDAEEATIDTMESPRAKSPQHDELWLNKYRPKHFIDLLSDERTNRDVLGWLKSWDACVFKTKAKPAPKPAFNLSASKQVEAAPSDDIRPEQKIILLCGPPGAGKTTLAGIAARHAGYNPIEVNASDDRTASVLREKIISAMEMQSIFGNNRPNCIILDEIDGALHGNEGRSAIGALQELVSIPYSTKKDKSKKKQAHPLIRPIICICNDQYAPVLRPLRKLAKIFVLSTPDQRQLMSRLKFICKQESLDAPTSILSSLCARADNDVRFCLNSLQFASAKTKLLTSSMVEDIMGRKDLSKGAYDVWDVVFYEPRQKKKENVVSGFARAYDAADRFGSPELVLNGLHDNLLPLAFNDPTMTKVHQALEWMEFADLCESRVRSHQQFALMSYMAVPAVAVSYACCTGSRRRIEYPKSYYDHRRHLDKSESILHAVVESNPSFRVGSRVLMVDIMPWLMRILNPQVHGVKDEKQQLDRLISLLSTLHISYRPLHLPGGITDYVLEPAIHELVQYSHLETARPMLPAASRQHIAREVELESLRRAEKSEIRLAPEDEPKAVNAPAGIYDRPHDIFQTVVAPAVPPASPVSAHPFGYKKRKRADDVTATRKRCPVRFKFNEGYTCGIKRPVLVQDLFRVNRFIRWSVYFVVPMGRDRRLSSLHVYAAGNNDGHGSTRCHSALPKGLPAPEAAHEPKDESPEDDTPEPTPNKATRRLTLSRPYDIPVAPPSAAPQTPEKTPSPRKMNRHSLTLLENRQRKPSVVDPGLKVEERLQQLGIAYALKHASKQDADAAQFSFQPKISYHSSKLARAGSVHDRLYSLAKPRTVADDVPTLAPSPAKPAAVGAGDRLYRKAAEFRSKQDAVRAAEARDAALLRNARKISAQSLRLLERSKGRGRAETDHPREATAPSKLVTPAEASAIYARQVQWKEAKAARDAAARWRRDVAEQQECTFQNPFSDGSARYDGPRDAFFRKATDWAKAREATLRVQQHERLAQELAACPFKPSRPTKPVQVDTSLKALLATFHEEIDASRPVPYPWRAYATAEGAVYYHNETTEETTWTFPRAA